MDEDDKNLLIGMIIGAILTILVWVAVADQVEISKVREGYLTLKNKTYTVVLYDTLDNPEKVDK